MDAWGKDTAMLKRCETSKWGVRSPLELVRPPVLQTQTARSNRWDVDVAKMVVCKATHSAARNRCCSPMERQIRCWLLDDIGCSQDLPCQFEDSHSQLPSLFIADSWCLQRLRQSQGNVFGARPGVLSSLFERTPGKILVNRSHEIPYPIGAWPVLCYHVLLSCSIPTRLGSK